MILGKWISKCGSLFGYGKKAFEWGKQVATGPDGMGSASRVVNLMVATTICGVLITHVILHRGLPQADQMYGLAALLGASSVAYTAKAFAGPPSPPPGAPNDPNGANSAATGK